MDDRAEAIERLCRMPFNAFLTVVASLDRNLRPNFPVDRPGRARGSVRPRARRQNLPVTRRDASAWRMRSPSKGQLNASIAVATALIAFAAAVACPSEAATSCARKVVDDWQGNGQVDRIYPFHCYRDAIRSLPVDVVDYSNAKEDILRALAFARRGKPDPGPAGGLRPTADDPTETTETPHVPDEPGEAIASTLVDTSSASSVPVPLLILGGLSILLLAAGGASHLGRRYRTRREGSPPDPH